MAEHAINQQSFSGVPWRAWEPRIDKENVNGRARRTLARVGAYACRCAARSERVKQTGGLGVETQSRDLAEDRLRRGSGGEPQHQGTDHRCHVYQGVRYVGVAPRPEHSENGPGEVQHQADPGQDTDDGHE
jgi:hypothetical protein